MIKRRKYSKQAKKNRHFLLSQDCDESPRAIEMAARSDQRTAFVLNEKGAEVESETIMAVTDSTSAVMERPQPKNLIFDKPFLILLKRTDSKNPYFAMFVANNELMEKPSSPK